MNIDIWTLDELRFMVAEFKGFDKPLNPSLEDTMTFENFESCAIDSIEARGQSDDDSYFNSMIMKNFLYTGDISLSKEKNDLTKKPPTIRIERVDKRSKNLFSTRLVYTVFTEPFNWRVERKESDFKWLVTKLRKEFPNLSYPFPDKKMDAKQMEEYLGKLTSNKHTLRSRFLMYFLSCQNKSKFYEKKAKDQNTKTVIEDVTILISEKVKEDFNNVKNKLSLTNKPSVVRSEKKTPSNQNTVSNTADTTLKDSKKNTVSTLKTFIDEQNTKNIVVPEEINSEANVKNNSKILKGIDKNIPEN